MNISGSGHIAAGEYNENISISGSGRLDGHVRCTSFSSSGSTSGAGDLECTDKMHVSGSASFAKNLKAREIHISGSCKVGGSCTGTDVIRISGGLGCDGRMRCGTLAVSGSVRADEGVDAEEIKISGKILCNGLINAEKIEMKLGRDGSRAGSIGGSDIRIYTDSSVKTGLRLPLLSKLVGRSGALTVSESIEGDVIALECVSAPLVVGRVVAVGAGCEIELVQYSEEIEIHPDAKVAKYEKV